MNINNFDNRIALINKKVKKIERTVELTEKYGLLYKLRALPIIFSILAALTIFITTFEYFENRRNQMIIKELPQESSREMIAKWVDKFSADKKDISEPGN